LALQNKVQKVADKLNKEVVVIAKGVQHIQIQAGTAYQLNTKECDAKKSSLIANKIGNDLEVTLKESVIIFDNYFAVCATDLSCLVSLPTEDGGLYHIVADVFFTLEDGTQILYYYGGSKFDCFFDFFTICRKGNSYHTVCFCLYCNLLMGQA
jgi:hypothetical protein